MANDRRFLKGVKVVKRDLPLRWISSCPYKRVKDSLRITATLYSQRRLGKSNWTIGDLATTWLRPAIKMNAVVKIGRST